MKTKLLVSALLSTAALAAHATVYRAGLQGGFINSYDSGKYNTVSIPDIGVFGSVEAGSVKANSNSNKTYPPIWADNRTWCYHGQMYFDGGTYYFAESSDDVVWMAVDGTQILKDGTWNNVGVSSAVTPTAGWHQVEIRFGNGTGGAGCPYDDNRCKDVNGKLCGFGVARYETAPGTKPSAMSAFTFVENTEGNVWLRTVEDTSYITVNSISQTEDGYSFNVTMSAPSAATVTIYAGATAGAADAATGWTYDSGAISFAANETKTIEVDGTFTTPPYFVAYLSGTGTTLEEGNGVAFWEWSDIKMCTMEPTVAVALAGVTTTSGTVSVTLGYDKVISGMTAPAIALKAYYGAADAGTTAADWDNVVDFGDANAVGTASRVLDNLAAGGSYYVRFAAKTPESDWVWSAPLSFSTGGLFLDAVPVQICENDPTTLSFKVCRSAAATAESLTVYLSYSGATDKVVGLPASVQLASGAAEAVVSFTMIDNDAVDGDATLTIAIAENGTYMLGSPSSAVVSVLDDESSSGEIIWTGAAGDLKWETAGNWDAVRVPTAMDTATFQDSGLAAGGTVTIDSAAECRILKISRLDAMTLAGTGSLKLGGITRVDLEGTEATVEIKTPLSVYPISDDNSVWDIAGSNALKLTGKTTKAVSTVYVYKTGAGLLQLNATNVLPNDSLRVNQGSVTPLVDHSVDGKIYIGGGLEAADFTAGDSKAHGVNPYVYTNGVFHAGNHVSNGPDRFNVYEGGYAWLHATYGGIVDLYGGEFYINYRMWTGAYTQHVNANQSDSMARMRGPMTCSDYYDFSIKVQDGAQPVDFYWVNSGITGGGTGYNFTISGSGTMQTVGSWDTPRNMSMSDTTWYMDGSETRGSGDGNLTVGNSATVGGTGAFGGNKEGQTLTIQGSSGKLATMIPGTISRDDGSHIYGTYTVGSITNADAVVFGNYSCLKAGVGPRDSETKLSPFDQLKVYGTVTINASNTTLDLTANTAALDTLASGATYTIVEADSITGTFATVLLPKTGWKVAYEADTVEGQSVVKRIVLAIPPAETVILLR